MGYFSFGKEPKANFPIKQERILLCRILRRNAILPRGLFYFIGDFIEIFYEIKKDISISNMSSESSDEQIRTADTTGMNRML